MTHIDHLVAVVQSEADRAKTVVEALETFRQTVNRKSAENAGSVRRLETECEECKKNVVLGGPAAAPSA